MNEGHGVIPNMNERVDRDHCIFVGSHRMSEELGVLVQYSNPVPDDVRKYVLDRIAGFNVDRPTLNGDLVFRTDDLARGKLLGLCATPPLQKPDAGREKVVLTKAGNTFREIRVN